jgi:hypothetical protein
MHLTPRQMADLRTEFAKGGLEASLLAAQLLEMVERLQAQVRAAEAAAAQARREVAAQEAAALQRRLDESAANGSGCSACQDGAARAAVAELRKMAIPADRRIGH